MMARAVVLAAFALFADDQVSLQREAGADVTALMARVRRDGLPEGAILIRSGYRPAADKNPLAAGVIRAFGRPELERWIAAHSEHVTGKSVDLDLGVAPTIANAQAGAFAKLPAYRWLRQHAREFGFNQAFPGEPWHFTHHLPAGSLEGPVPGTVSPDRLGTVARRAPPDSHLLEPATQVLTGSAVAWLPGSEEIVYTQCWREEGGGDGCVVKWESRADHRVTKTIPVFSPGEADTEKARHARLIAASKAIDSALDRATLLQPRSWGAHMLASDAREPQQIVWNPARSTLAHSGKPATPIAQLAPWKPWPFQFYTERHTDFAVVEVLYDPQEAFTDGANLVSRFEIVEGLPRAPGPGWRKGMPPDVLDLIGRYQSCTHWGAEEAYDAERRKEIEDNVEELRCDQVEDEQRQLRLKYAGKRPITDLLDVMDLMDDDD